MANKLDQLRRWLDKNLPPSSSPLTNQAIADNDMGGYATYPAPAPTPMQNQPMINEQVPQEVPPLPDAHENKSARVGLSPLEKEYEKMLKQSLEQQQGGIDQQQKDALSSLQLQNEQPADASPLYRLLNSWYGLKTGEGYKSPPSVQENMDKQIALQNMIQDSRESLSKNKINALKALLDRQQLKQGDARDARFQSSQVSQKEKEFRGVAQKISNAQSEYQKQNDVVENALNSGKVFRVEQVKSYLSRLMGEKGVLTDQDLARAIPPTLAYSWEKLLSRTDLDSPAPPELISELREGLKDLKDGVARELRAKTDRLKDNFTGGEFNIMNREYAPRVVKNLSKNLESFGGVTNQAQAAKQVPQPKGSDEFEQFLGTLK